MEVKPLSQREIDRLNRRADCMNRVHDFCNEVGPMLLRRLEAGFTQKVSGELYQRDLDGLKEIVEAVAKDIRLNGGRKDGRLSTPWIRADQYGIKLEVRDDYPVAYHHGGGHSCEYYSRTIYLWNCQDNSKHTYNRMFLQTGQELQTAALRLEAVKTMISDLESEASRLRRKVVG